VYRRRMRGYVRKERAILLNVMIPLRPFSSPAEVHKETTHLSAMSSEASFVDIGCPEDCYPTIIILCHCLSSPPPHVDDTGTSPIPMTKSVNHLDGVLPGPLFGPWIRIEIDPSYTRGRFLGQAGRRDWGPSTWSKYSEAPSRSLELGSIGLAECPSRCCR